MSRTVTKVRSTQSFYALANFELLTMSSKPFSALSYPSLAPFYTGPAILRARICIPLKEPRYRFPAWRAGTKSLFVVLARQATWASEIDSSESIPGLHKRLQIRAQVYSPYF
jgi:hypothetical protein